MIYIGIDPDVEKSGVAIQIKKEWGIQLYNKSYMEIYGMLSLYNGKADVLVVIEKGELNKAIFKATKPNPKVRNKLAHAAKIGSSVGRNFEATNIIEQFCIFLNLNYLFYVPTREMPKFSHKWAALQFKLNVKRSNEEQRDALRCIMKYIL